MKSVFIDKIIEKNDQKSILVSNFFTLDKYPFLQDHAFDQVAVIPAVMIMEMICETAVLLFPGHFINKIRDIDFRTFIKIPHSAAEEIFVLLQTEFLKNNSLVLSGVVYHYFINNKLKIKRKKTISAVSLHMTNNKSQPGKYIFPFLPIADTGIKKENIYPRLVSLGRSFQHLHEVMSIDREKGLCGSLRSNFNSGQYPVKKEMVLGDFFLRDSAFHLASLWGTHFSRGFNIPFRMQNITFFSVLDPNVTYFCRAVPVSQNNKSVVMQLSIIDAGENLAENYEQIEFTFNTPLPEDRFSDCNPLAARRKKLENLNIELNFIQEKLNYFSFVNVETLKHHLPYLEKKLSRDEYSYYDAYKPETSRLEFLAGRVFTKFLLCSYFKEKKDQLIDFSDIDIKRDDMRKPILYIKGEKTDQPDFSITHKDGLVLCALTACGHLGIDIENISETLRNVRKHYIDENEEAIIYQGCENDQEKLVNLARVWSAKESIVKYYKSEFFTIANKAKVIKKLDNSLLFKIENNSGNIHEVFNRQCGDYMISVVL